MDDGWPLFGVVHIVYLWLTHGWFPATIRPLLFQYWTSLLTCFKLNQMLILNIFCAYNQFEHLLARAFIVAHMAQHHLEHFYILIAILLKLIFFLHFLHSTFDPCILWGGVVFFLFLPCLKLAECTCKQGDKFWENLAFGSFGDISSRGSNSQILGNFSHIHLFVEDV